MAALLAVAAVAAPGADQPAADLRLVPEMEEPEGIVAQPLSRARADAVKGKM